MVFSLQQRIVIVEAYLRIGSIKETQQVFLKKITRDKSTSKTFRSELGKKMARNRLYRASVSANVVKRAQKCIDVNGEHFQHLL